MIRSSPGTVAFAMVLLEACGGGLPPAPASGPVARAASSAGRLEERYDETRDATVVRVVPAVEPGAARLLAGATYPGRSLQSPPGSVLIGFRRSGPAWRYEGCAALTLLADGIQLAEGPALRDTELGAGELCEYLTTAVSLAAVARFAWAARAEIRACGDTIAFTREDRELLSRLIKRITPP
jgi:hypothetical protein